MASSTRGGKQRIAEPEAENRQLSLLLSGRLHQALFTTDSTFTRFMARLHRQLQVLTAIIAGIVLLFINVTPRNILLLALASLVVITTIDILAAPRSGILKSNK